MFKLFQNLLASEAEPKETELAKSDLSNWEAQLAQADLLWKQGEFKGALAIYDLAIEQNPNLPEIKQRLVGRVKEQGNLAVAYERLAAGLKNQGEIEQAANYYRQAINLKALTGNTQNQLLRSNVVPLKKSPIPIADLKVAAFSFQPLTNTALVRVKPTGSQQLNLSTSEEIELTPDPQFFPRIKPINPQQAKQIDWETAQVYFQKALEHLEKQEWEQSALACKQATQILPNMAEAYKIWGNALQRMGKTGEAMACYAKAVEVKPNLAEVYSGIADIYAQQSKWDQAIKHYQKAIIIQPSAKNYRKLAVIWEKLGEIEKAEFNLARATELKLAENLDSKKALDLELATIDQNKTEEVVAAYCRVAKQLEQDNQWQEAAKYYREAVQLSTSRPTLPPGKSAERQLQAATTLMNSPEKASVSQLDRAIQRYHKQAKLQPNSPKIYTDLGNLYAKKASFAQAIACYNRAIKLNRKYPHAHLNLAKTFLKTGKQQEFIQEMQLALALQPSIGTAMDRFSLAEALIEQNQEQQGIGFYCKAIAFDPKFASSYHRLSDILGKQGKHHQAIQFLQQGIKENPQAAELYYLLAQQSEHLHNWEDAVKCFSRVLQIDPQYPQASKKLNHALAQKLKFNRQTKSASVSESIN